MKNPVGKRIKILYGLEAAGAGALKNLTYLVNNLNTSLFDITVIISTKRSPNVFKEIKKMKDSGARVLIIPMEREINLWKDICSIITICNHLRANYYDIIHAHSSKAGVLFRISGWLASRANLIYTPHCFYFQSKTGIKQTIYAYIEKLMSRITNRIVVSSIERFAALTFNIVGNQKLININNAVDFNEYNFNYSKFELKRELCIPLNAIVIGSVGRLTEQKDWLTYIYSAKETLKKIPNAIFLIVGDGELLEDLNNIIKRLNLQRSVITTGHVFEISKIYSIIDIFLSTSLWEGLPYVLLEAMCFKKPIVATNLGYNDVVVDNVNGYLVTIKDYKLVSNKIIKLINNKKLCQRMGEKGYKMIKRKFTFEKFIYLHEQLYLKV